MAAWLDIADHNAASSDHCTVTDFDIGHCAGGVVKQNPLSNLHIAIDGTTAEDGAVAANTHIMPNKVLRQYRHVISDRHIDGDSGVRVDDAALSDCAEGTDMGVWMNERYNVSPTLQKTCDHSLLDLWKA